MALALIEDDCVQRLSMQAQLSRLGAEVTTFSSGAEFLSKGCSVEQGFTPWDLIIVDYVMPEMNGIETISSLPAQITDSARVCVVSGNDLGAQDQSFLDTRQMNFVRKMPSTCREIWNLVNKSPDAQDSTKSFSSPSHFEAQSEQPGTPIYGTPQATTHAKEVKTGPRMVDEKSVEGVSSIQLAAIAESPSDGVAVSNNISGTDEGNSTELIDNAVLDTDEDTDNCKPSAEQYEMVAKVLQDVAAFKALSRDKFLALVSSVRLARFSPGEVECSCAAPSMSIDSRVQVIATEQCNYPYCSVILGGKIQVSRQQKGVLGEMERGKWFGNFIRSRLAMATVISVSDTMLAQMSYQDYEEILILNQSIPVPQVKYAVGLEDIRLSAQPLGHGTFAEVYRCSMRGSACCALKCMRKETVVELGATTQVMNEISLLKTLSHPYIASFLGVLQDLSRIYLLQELVPGGELFEYLETRGVIREDEAQFYLANICAALEYVHSKDVLYRDLKPENLVFGADGYLKLVDFGFAKQLPKTGLTYTVCGTPEYVAPEIIGRGGYGHVVDYWSAGILLYEMLTGCTPYATNGDVFEMYKLISSNELSLPPGVQLSAEAWGCICGLLSKDPETRLGNVQPLRNHSWYAITDDSGQQILDWSNVESGHHRAPYVPTQKQLDGVSDTITSILPPTGSAVRWNPIV